MRDAPFVSTAIPDELIQPPSSPFLSPKDMLQHVPERGNFNAALRQEMQRSPGSIPLIASILSRREQIERRLDHLKRPLPEPPKLAGAVIGEVKARSRFVQAQARIEDLSAELDRWEETRPTGLRRFVGMFTGGNRRHAAQLLKIEGKAKAARADLEKTGDDLGLAEVYRSTVATVATAKEAEAMQTRRAEGRQLDFEMKTTAVAALAILRTGAQPDDPKALLTESARIVREGAAATARPSDPSPNLGAAPAPAM